MEWVETTGPTVAEALERALDQLGVDEQEAEVQVLDEPKKGLFGRLRVEARVRARVKPTRPRPKVERRDRRRRGGGDRDRPSRGRGRQATSTRNDTGTGRSTTSPGNGDDRSASRGAKPASSGNGTDEREVAAAATESAGSTGSDKRKRRRRRRGGQPSKQGAAVENGNEESTDEPRAALDLDEQRDAVESFLTGLLEAFGRPEASISVVADEDSTLDAKVEGDELGLLVGPKGQTLQAIHELVRSMVQRRFVGQSHARIRVDVAGYRQRRKEALERFTRTVAEEVRSSGRAKVLDPMGASDRKVVHDVINDLDGVSTISEGEEPDRRVIIQPG